MMHGPEKSDSSIVATKPTNKVARAAEEPVERRGEAKENAGKLRMRRTQCRESVSRQLDRVRQAVKRGEGRFTALLHHVSEDLLLLSFFWLKRKAAVGVDGVSWADYEEHLEARLADLHKRIHSNAYQAQPSKRQYIPKPDGQQRPLGIAALEDKIVQRALVAVLNAIYEHDFLGFSYGFRPGRGQHDALDALAAGIKRTKVNWILDADIRKFFDSVNHDWLIRFLEHRIGDLRVINIIRKWLKAGVMEDGVLHPTEDGTPQGSVASPLLANVFLHYVYDLWVNHWRKHHARGHLIVVRYADDTVVGFERADDARRFLVALRVRLEKFSLTLHPDKTRLIEFGRFAASNRQTRGLGKPETFDFLGFTHIAGRTLKGGFLLVRRTRRDRMRAALHALKEELRRRMHDSIAQQGQWLQKIVKGYFAYHAVPTNYSRLAGFRDKVMRAWMNVLRRRSQRQRITWDRMSRIATEWLPVPRILHPWPEARFAAKHPR